MSITISQGFVTLVGFLLTYFLGTWGTIADVGTFSIAQTLILLLLTLHAAYISEPMLARVAKLDLEEEYFGGLVVGTLCIVCLFLAVVWAFLMIRREGSYLIAVAVPLSVAFATSAFFSLLERSELLSKRHRAVMLIGAMQFIVVCLGLIFLDERADAYSAIWLICCGQFISAAVALTMRKFRYTKEPQKEPRAERESQVKTIQMRAAAMAHIRYGNHALLAALLWWGGANGLILLAASTLAFEDIGLFRLGMMILAPLNIIFGALGVHILSEFSDANYGIQRLRNRLNLYVSLVILVGGAFSVLFVLFGPVVIDLLFGGRYLLPNWMILIMSALALLWGLQYVLGSYVRAIGRIHFSTASLIVALGVSVLLWMLFYKYHGVTGLAAAITTNAAINVAVLLLLIRKFHLASLDRTN
jgi:O-antigen/teichoic acid export membrane protein